MLLHCLQAEGKTYDNIYDWNEEYERSKPQPSKLSFKLHQDQDMDIECEPNQSLDQMNNYHLIAKGNHAAMNADSQMNHGFDKERVSFSNPHGFKKDASPQEYQQWVAVANGKLNNVCSPTTIRNN